jgi:uncharacterized membrane protein (DUF485 family)
MKTQLCNNIFYKLNIKKIFKIEFPVFKSINNWAVTYCIIFILLELSLAIVLIRIYLVSAAHTFDSQK